MVSKNPHTSSDTQIVDELQQNRAFLRSVFDRIPGMIYVHDLVNDVNLYRSWSLKKVLGFEESDLLNSGKGIRALAHPDDLSEFKRAARELQEVEDDKSVRFMYRMRHRNGNWLWFRSEEYVYERDEQGRPTKCLGYATELTETVEQNLRMDELNRLNELLLNAAKILSASDLEPKEILNILAKELSLHFDVVCDISILDTNTEVIIPQALFHPDPEITAIIGDIFAKFELRRGQGQVGKVIETGKEVLFKIVPDEMRKRPADIDPRIVPESLMYVPLKGKSSVLGSLNLTRLSGQRPFSDTEVDQIRRIGEYLSLFIENVLLREQQQAIQQLQAEVERQLATEKRWAEFKLETSSILAEVDAELSEILQRLCERISTFFDVVSDVQLLDEQRGKVVLTALYHYDPKVRTVLERTIKKREVGLGEGMAGKVVQTGRELYVDQLPEHLHEKALKEKVDPLIIPCSFAYIPLKSHDKVLGTLDLTRLSWQQPITHQELFQMRDLAEHISRFMENRLLQEAQAKEIELRKRAEKRLARTSQILERMEADTRSMLNTIPIYISRVSKDLRYRFLNDYYVNMGIDPRTMEGRFVSEVIGEDQLERLRPNFEKVLAGETISYSYHGKAGNAVRYMDVVQAPDYSESGEVVGFYSCAVDVTEKVLAEQERKLTEDRFQSLSLNSGDAFFFHDDEQNIIDVNEVATEMLGYTRSELLSMKVEQIDPRWAGNTYLKYLSSIKVNDPQTFEADVVAKDGRIIPVEVRFVKREENGKTYIQSLLRDRTEKKEQERKLQQSEERLRLIFENVEDFIATVNADGVFESINKTSQGLDPEEVIGSSIYEFYDSEEKEKLLRTKFAELKQTGERFELEDSYTGPDGSVHTYSRKFIGIFHGTEFFKCILIIRDVTAEREKERSVMNAMLKGQEQERKRLGAELHDGIGQVLSAIALKASRTNELARQKQYRDIEPDLLELNVGLQEAIKELRNISHDLMPDVLESFGLKDAVQQICNSFSDRSGIKVAFSHYDLEDKYDQSIEVNMFRIAQELLNNVHKHSGGTNVHVSLMDHGDTLGLTVEDDGVGFDLNADSIGIGLRNIRSRVRMMQGEIDVESSPNSGTLVNIEVPKSIQ